MLVAYKLVAYKKNEMYINIKTTHPISLKFFSIFFVLCISSNKLNSISRGTCLSFRRSHLQLFCKIVIQLSSIGIFLGLCMVKRSALQLYRTTIFLAQLWVTASNHLINKYGQKLRQVKNQIINRQTRKKN